MKKEGGRLVLEKMEIEKGEEMNPLKGQGKSIGIGTREKAGKEKVGIKAEKEIEKYRKKETERKIDLGIKGATAS